MRHPAQQDPRNVVALALVSTALLTGCGGGGGDAVDELSVTGAWARPTPDGAENGVVYFSIASPVDDTIIGVGVPRSVAAEAAVHASVGADDAGGHEHHGSGDDAAVTMAEQERITLPAGTAVQFEPGGLHVMLTELPDPLVEGEQFDLTIELASGESVAAEVLVAHQAP